MSVRCRVCHDELLKACAENAELVKQKNLLGTKLAKTKEKMAHHLRERDRYRDLYLEAQRKLRDAIVNNPDF